MPRFSAIAFLAIAVLVGVSAASATYLAPLHPVHPVHPVHQIVYPAAHVYSAHSSSLITPSQQQYLTQDEFGQYSYGYNEPLSAKQEARSLDGTTRGSYSYRDAEGKLQTVAYTADANGFHVAATNLPRAVAASETPAPVADTVEVAAARNAHLAAVEKVKLRIASGESNTIADSSESRSASAYNARLVELPQPVEDTVAVATAKAQHLKRFQQEKLRNEILGAAHAHAHVHSPNAIVRTIVPGVYGYPLNSHILSNGFYY